MIKFKLIAAAIGGICTAIGGIFATSEACKELKELRNK